MKKLLSSILLTCLFHCCHGQEINFPQFDVICDQSSIGYNKEAAAFFAIRNYVAYNEELPLASIEGILTQWYQEKPELRTYTLGGAPDVDKASFTDVFVVLLSAVSQLSDRQGPYFMHMCILLERCQEIVRVLKKLGVEQTISDEQVHIFGEQLAKELLED